MQITIRDFYDYYVENKKGDVWDFNKFQYAFSVFMNELQGNEMTGLEDVPYTIDNKAVFFNRREIINKVSNWKYGKNN